MQPTTTKQRKVLRQDRGVTINSRLTAMFGGLLFVLLGIEGLTIVLIHKDLYLHIFFGMLLIPPILFKLGTTVYKAFKYYVNSPGSGLNALLVHSAILTSNVSLR